MSRQSFLIITALLMFLMVNTSIAAIGYDVIDLGTLAGYETMLPWAINNNGQVVGYAMQDSYPVHTAVLFDSTGNGNVVDLDNGNSSALAINNSGQIVGCVGEAATLFDSSGQSQNTQLYSGASAYAINDSGIATGSVYGSGDIERAALFDAGVPGTYTDLGVLSGSDSSVAISINSTGDVVGYACSSENQYMFDTRAVLFDILAPENNVDLGSLTGYGAALAFSINDSGQIVGRANHSDATIPDNYVPRAVLFDASGAGDNVDLGTIDGISGAEAFSINNNGQIVGRAIEAATPGYSVAVLFDPTGQGNNINLNELIDPALGYRLNNAIAINDNGWIACWATNINQDYYSYALLLKPVPEPGTMILLGLGCFFIMKRGNSSSD